MMQDKELPVSYERRMWARQWLLRTEQRGAFHTLFQELAVEDSPGAQRIYEDALFKIRGFGRTNWALYEEERYVELLYVKTLP